MEMIIGCGRPSRRLNRVSAYASTTPFLGMSTQYPSRMILSFNAPQNTLVTYISVRPSQLFVRWPSERDIGSWELPRLPTMHFLCEKITRSALLTTRCGIYNLCHRRRVNPSMLQGNSLTQAGSRV